MSSERLTKKGGFGWTNCRWMENEEDVIVAVSQDNKGFEADIEQKKEEKKDANDVEEKVITLPVSVEKNVYRAVNR